MKKTISSYDFRRAFEQSSYSNNFSYDALGLLFDYFEQLESDCGTEIEFDMVTICCEYEETHWKDIRNSYGNDLETDATIEDVIEYLQDSTQYIGQTNIECCDCLVFQSF
jgi:predicted ArsR family transcriptional regulator